jgi:hypothetical protein
MDKFKPGDVVVCTATHSGRSWRGDMGVVLNDTPPVPKTVIIRLTNNQEILMWEKDFEIYNPDQGGQDG